MHILSKRFQSVSVVTLSTLREHLETISTPDCKFKIEKVRDDRITVRSESLISGKKISVVLPAYPTGHEHDVPGNPNVVLDPLSFAGADACAETEVFAPLLGHDVLDYYHKLHPHTVGLSVSRCC
ncbi:MAG: hypothetical protein ABSD96_06120 [Candidatus Korobacteraceae bacterium]|jgi:hypothetical protein